MERSNYKSTATSNLMAINSSYTNDLKGITIMTTLFVVGNNYSLSIIMVNPKLKSMAMESF